MHVRGRERPVSSFRGDSLPKFRRCVIYETRDFEINVVEGMDVGDSYMLALAVLLTDQLFLALVSLRVGWGETVMALWWSAAGIGVWCSSFDWACLEWLKGPAQV